MEYNGKRFEELAQRSYQTGQYVFSEFLTQGEQDIFLGMERQLDFAKPVLFGGYEGAERRILIFGSEEELGYPAEPPIECLLVAPLSEKFAVEYNHRDYLGALMGLGMERRMFGDICVSGKSAYIFVLERAADYIIENLTGVGRNNVKVSRSAFPEDFIEKKKKRINVQVQSMRADGIISKAYGMSRAETLELFRQLKVTVNGRTSENNDRQLAEGDVVSVRGFGKFAVSACGGITRKGKLNVGVDIYS